MKDDLISRQAAIEELQNHYEVRNPKQNAIMDECVMLLSKLPSAQTTGESCWGCNCPKMERLNEQKTFSEMVHLHDAETHDERTETHSCDCEHTETHGWIPVTEALPKEEDCPMDCLVTRKSKFIGNYTDMAVCEKNGTWTHEDWDAIVLGDVEDGKSTGLISTRDDNIIAWMPLPEPYKEEQND